MDLAKITATVYTHGGTYHDYFNFDNVPGPVCPLIAVPTTAGTGSEVSHAAVLTDHDNGTKVSTLSNHLRPELAVVDPELTATCPRKATADSGIDALTHAIEAYLATHSSELDVPAGEVSPYDGKFSLADVLAEKAIALVGEHLVTAVNEPDNHRSTNRDVPGGDVGGAGVFRMRPSRLCTRWSTRWAARCIARTEKGTGCCCRM